MIQPSDPHERSFSAPKFEDRTLDDTLAKDGKRWARSTARDLAKTMHKLKRHVDENRATFFSTSEVWCLAKHRDGLSRGRDVVSSQPSRRQISGIEHPAAAMICQWRPKPSLLTFHEDHSAGKGFNSMSLQKFGTQIDSYAQVSKIQDALAAVDKKWNNLETISAWQLHNVKSKKEVIQEAQIDKRKVHFGTLMDICHLKNSKSEPRFQKIQRSSRSPR